MIQDLQLKDIICTRTNRINLGRDPFNLEICRYEDGDEKLMSVEGVSYQDPVGRIASCISDENQ